MNNFHLGLVVDSSMLTLLSEALLLSLSRYSIPRILSLKVQDNPESEFCVFQGMGR